MRGKYFRQLGEDNEDLRREAAAIERGMSKGADSDDDSSHSSPTNDGSDDVVPQSSVVAVNANSKNPFGTIRSKRRRNARLLAEINGDAPHGNGSSAASGSAAKSPAVSKTGASGGSSAAGASANGEKKAKRRKGESKNGANGEKAQGGSRKTRTSSKSAMNGQITSAAVESAEQALHEYAKTANAVSGSSPRTKSPTPLNTDVDVPISVVQMNLAHLELQDARAKTRDLESRLSKVHGEKRAKEVELATALERIRQLEMQKSPSKEEIENTKMTARNLQKSIETYKAEQDELEQLKKALRNELRAKNGEEIITSSDSEDDDDESSTSSSDEDFDREGLDAEFEEKWLVDTNEVAAVLAERRRNQRKGKKGHGSQASLSGKPSSPRGHGNDVPKKPSLLDGGATNGGSSDSVGHRKKKSSSSSARLEKSVDAVPWFKAHYEASCQTVGVKPLDDLILVLDRASSKGRRVMELDLNNYNLTSQDVMALARAFSLTSVDISKLSAESVPTVVSNSFEPVAVDLSHNQVTSGRVFVELLLASGSNSVVALDVGFNAWGPKAAMEFSEGLSSYPHLRTLKCAQNNLGAKAGALLFKALLNCKSLEVLDVSNNALTERVAPNLATVITTCPLTTLIIKYNKFKSSGIKKIAAAIAMNTSLTELDLTSTGINEKSKEIVDILETRQNMAKLSIGFNKLPSSFIPRFTSFTAKQTKLVHVDLRGLDLSSKQLRQVIDALSVNSSGTLEELVLNGNVLDAKCMELLIDYVTRTQNLHSIGLRGCGVPKKSLIELLGTIKHSVVIKAIDLSGNNMNDRRILEALNSCLQANSTLNIIGLAACKIDAKIVGSIGQALQFNKRLEKIHIDGNKLGERGLNEFANGLAGNEVLRVVSIRTCGVSARGLLSFLTTVTAKSQVEVIDAGDNNLPVGNKAFRDRVNQYDAIAVKF